MKNIVFAASIIVMSAFPASATTVSSLTRPVVVTGDNGEEYRQVSVRCQQFAEPRHIRARLDGGDWCVKHAPSACSRNKVSAARQACKIAIDTEQQKKAAVKSTTATQAQSNQSEADRLALQTELLKIEKRRLEIQSKQLELTKQKLQFEKTLIAR